MSSSHEIRTPYIMALCRAAMIIVVALFAVLAPSSYAIYYVIFDILLVAESGYALWQLKKGHLSSSIWYAWFAGLETIVILVLLYQVPDLYIWPFLLWTIFDATINARSQSGILLTIISDLVAIIMIVTRISGVSLRLDWIAVLALLNLVGFPFMYLAYWSNSERLQLEKELEETKKQTDRVEELESITRQITDYAMDVQERAVRDQLTGLYIQTFFHHRLLIEVEKARQNHTPISLLLLDIDHFKSFNDRFGHYLGDDILRAVAKVLLDVANETFWIPGRIGGEEMCIAMPEISIDSAFTYADTIRQRIENVIVQGPSEPLHVTVSVGVASFPETSQDAMQLSKNADQAMYAAKANGRNQTISYRNLSEQANKPSGVNKKSTG
nr:GGDEF domain-containing protein [Bacilli bacterium]